MLYNVIHTDIRLIFIYFLYIHNRKDGCCAGDIGCFLVLASFFAMVFVEVGGCEPGNAGDLLHPQILVLD